MRTYQVTQRVGEDMGPVDWDAFMASKEFESSDSRMVERVEWLKAVEANPGAYRVSNYGGWPRIWRSALRVRLYDGWPYWRPLPAVLSQGPLGPEWIFWSALTGIDLREDPATTEGGTQG